MPINLNKINVVDVESTCWKEAERPDGQVSEIIEIGICVLDRQSWAIEDKRSILIRPEQSTVSAFCTELTTLTPAMVQNGVTFAEACQILRTAYKSRRRLWASWGDYDRNMLHTESARKAVDDPFGNTHLNVKILFAILNGCDSASGMPDALETLGLALQGTHHRGHDDAYNIAAILRKILQTSGAHSTLSTQRVVNHSQRPDCR